jgi:hypothetical protein
MHRGGWTNEYRKRKETKKARRQLLRAGAEAVKEKCTNLALYKVYIKE